MRLVFEAENGAKEARAHAQWCALLPLMQLKYVEYESFRDYFDRITGKNIDMRPASEILAEVRAVREELEVPGGTI